MKSNRLLKVSYQFLLTGKTAFPVRNVICFSNDRPVHEVIRQIMVSAVLILFLLLTAFNLRAANRYSVATGNWNSTGTWSATSGGASGASAPVAGDNVYIEGGKTVTINVNANCTNLSIASGSALNIGGYNTNFTGTTEIRGTLTVTSSSGSKTFSHIIITGGTWTSSSGESFGIFKLTLSGSTIGGSSTGIFNISDTLKITEGTDNTINRSTFTITGPTIVDGSLIFGNATGIKTFTGTVTNNGTWSNTANSSINLRGGFINNGNFVSGTGTYTFSNASQTISGSSPMVFDGIVAISGVISISNLNNVTINGNLTGSVTGSTWINGANSTLKAGNAVLANGTLNATASGNTVIYSRNGTQTVKPTTYYNLHLGGTSAKTTSGITVNNILKMEGTATATVAPTYGAGASLRYDRTDAQIAGAEWPVTFSGTGGVKIENTGVITLNNAKTISNSLTIASGASINLSTFENTAGTLTLGSDGTVSGSWGSSGSVANNQNDIFFAVSTGYIDVTNSSCATPVAPTTTGAFICIGSTATLSASGAETGQKYKWYSAVTGGTLLKTSADNLDNTFTTPVLPTSTSYWVSILGNGGCESSRTQVTATYPAVSTNDQNAAGSNSWIGHVYDGTNQSVAYNGEFTSYYGSYTEGETFDQSFSGSQTCFGFFSNSEARSIYTETYSVRYRMNSNRRGLYIADMGSDDGGRLTVDGTLIYNNWTDQGFNSRPRVLLPLNGNSLLVYDFYENGGQNRVVFQNLTLVLSNTLTTNISQEICLGSTGVAIGGDNYGALPEGITLSGTGYQWAYSATSASGPWFDISGATSETFTPTADAAPFNTAGTYYIIRKALLSSANNVSPNPYTGGNESNAATLTVSQPTQVSVIISANPSGMICPGTSVTFTATPANGGETPVFQWKLNGMDVGTNSATFTDATLENGDIVTCHVTSDLPCTSGNPATSNEITMTMYPASAGGTISGGTSPLCQGNATGTMTVTGYNGSILRWERQINSGGWTNIGNAGNGSFSETPWSSGTWAYRVVVQAGNCQVDYSVVKSITVDANTVAGWLSGSSTPICEGVSTGTITLIGSTGSIVRWEKRVDAGAWAEITNNSTTYAEVPGSGGTWEYRALVQSGSCSAIYSTNFSIFVNPALSVTPGPNPAICRGVTTAQLTYSATTGNPKAYSIDFDGVANSAGLGDVSGYQLNPDQISIYVPWNIASGVYNGILTVSTYFPACSSEDYPITITIDDPPLADPITGNTSVMIGSSQIYSVTNTTGTNYSWSFPSGWVQTAGGTTNSVTVTVGAGSGNIQVIPSNSCGTGDAQTLPVTVTSNYCTATSTVPQLYESITNVTFAGINNSSPVAKTTGYTDYTGSVAPAAVGKNITYPISVSEQFIAAQYSGYCKVFIDYNQNGVFDTPDETAFEAPYTQSMIMAGNITIPANAMVGTTRMRVVVRGDGTAATTLPCGTFSWGEVEDYLVEITSVLTPTLVVTPASVNFGAVASGSTSAPSNYTLSGINLSPAVGNVTVTAPANFKVSLSSGSGFATSINVPYSGSILSETTIYVNFSPTTPNKNYNGNIINSVGGALDKSVNVFGTSLLYCSSYGHMSYKTGVTLVKFNTITSPSGKPSGYSDYFITQSTDVVLGNAYDLTVNVNTDGNYTSHTFAWIDWNQNGSFTDSGEAYDLGTASNTANGISSLCPYSITIPANAASGRTRMRVSSKYANDPSPCLTDFDGEVEDYCIHVLSSYQYIYRTIASGNWETANIWEYSPNEGANWTTATSPPSSTDGTITIRTPDIVTLTNSVSADELTIDAGGTLALMANMTVANESFEGVIVNGTLDCNAYLLTGEGSFSLNSGATLKISSTDGISLSGAYGNIQTSTRTFSAGANYIYNGVAAQITGSGLPSIVNNLTISNSQGVTLTNSVTLNGTLSLNSGEFIAADKTITFQNADTPVTRLTGTITTQQNTNLIFGTPGNTGGADFTLPTGTFTVSHTFNNLTINRLNDLSLSDQMISLTGKLLVSSGTLNTNDNLTLRSSATQTALIDGAGNGEVLGDVIMQRYLTSGFGYKYFSSPFQAATVAEFGDDMDLTAAFPTFYTYIENKETTGWTGYNDPSGILSPFAGYCINFGTNASATTADVTGVVNNGTIGPLALFNNDKTYTKGFNLLGNPYPSPIDWNAEDGWTKTNIDDGIYFFNAGTTDQFTGTYSSYVNGISSDGIAGNIIPSMQGFFVHVTDDAFPVSGSISISNQARVSQLSPVFHKSQQSRFEPMVRLSAEFMNDSKAADPLVLYLDQTASANFEKETDALKIYNTTSEVPSLFAISGDNRQLSIGAFPYPDIETEIALGIKTEISGTLILKMISSENIPGSLGIYLKDKASGRIQNLDKHSDYTFSVEQGLLEGRLALVFSETDISQELFGSNSFIAFSVDENIYADIQLREEQVNVQVINLAGQVILDKAVNGAGRHFIGATPVAGIYIITFFTDMGTISKKIFVQ